MRGRISMVILGLLIVLPAPATAISQLPVPVTSGAPWQIEDERLLDVEADHVVLSPDGEWIAGMGPGESICVWNVATLTPACAGEGLPIRAEAVTWAPDSSSVAFALDGALLGWESDIYLFERRRGELRNLTDDGMVVDRAGGEPVVLVRLDVDEPFAVWTPMFWLADGRLVYPWNEPDLADANNGVWSVGVDDGSSSVQVVPGGEGTTIPAVIVSDVAGDQALVYSWSLMRNVPGEGGVTAFWVVDLVSGEPDMLFAGRAIDAGFSPDEGTVLLVTDASDGPLLMTMVTATGEISPLDPATREGAILPGAPQ